MGSTIEGEILMHKMFEWIPTIYTVDSAKLGHFCFRHPVLNKRSWRRTTWIMAKNSNIDGNCNGMSQFYLGCISYACRGNEAVCLILWYSKISLGQHSCRFSSITNALRLLVLLSSCGHLVPAFGPSALELGKNLPDIWYLWNYNTFTSYVVDNIIFGNQRTRLPLYNRLNHVSRTITI